MGAGAGGKFAAWRRAARSADSFSAAASALRCESRKSCPGFPKGFPSWDSPGPKVGSLLFMTLCISGLVGSYLYVTCRLFFGTKDMVSDEHGKLAIITM